MPNMIKRVYSSMLLEHFAGDDSMVFLAGPRQVGKTTLSRILAEQLGGNLVYLNWDLEEHQQLILKGAIVVADFCQLSRAAISKPVIIFDEIHKYAHWKNFLKGFFDLYQQKARIIVTGSARLDIYKRGSDSLMGRYFSYGIHPFTVGELSAPESALSKSWIFPPKPLSKEDFWRLFRFGGFPKPYVQQSTAYSRRWHQTRRQQLFQEDIRSLANVHDLTQMNLLASCLKQQAGQLVNFSSLAKLLKSTIPTIQRWITLLSESYYCFMIRPWHTNVIRSLIKEPKIFLRDWSEIQDDGARAENFVAAHLLKMIDYWNDTGLGETSLHFIRDKEKNEVDFLLVKNHKPWILIEVKKSGNAGLSRSLYRFHEQLGTAHAFQVVLDSDESALNCLDYTEPTIIPANTFLSQLI